MEKGININALFASNVFFHRFEFEEWTDISTNYEKVIGTYHGSFFGLRKAYAEIFPELAKEEAEKQAACCDDDSDMKPRKIIYTLNALTKIRPREGEIGFLEQCEFIGGDDDYPDGINLFEAKAIHELINYKWDAYGKHLHFAMFFWHFCYIAFLTGYIWVTYLYGEEGAIDSVALLVLITLGIVAPWVYDTIQMCNAGLGYFEDPWNISDFLFIYLGLMNILL